VAAQTSLTVSIVISNYNYGRFLPDAIDSALAQAYQPIEVVVVDDGSTDDSRDVIDSYGSRIVPVMKVNGGHTSAVNAGFAASMGNIVIFLDGDDFLYPECVETVVEAWEENLAKIQYRLDVVDRDGKNCNNPFPFFSKDLTPERVLQRSIKYGFYPWTVSSGNAYSRQYLTAIMPICTARFPKVPDGYANKLAPLFGRVKTLPLILGAYRVHGANDLAKQKDTQRSPQFARFVRFEKDLHEHFMDVASRHGYSVVSYERSPLPQYLESRVLSFRYTPEEHPIAGEGRGRLMLLGLRSAAMAPDLSPPGRVFWAVWFLALATLPKAVLGPLMNATRSTDSRAPLARWLIGLSRR
jgi:glycosyltransferase involved in cell wall biosynthesis